MKIFDKILIILALLCLAWALWSDYRYRHLTEEPVTITLHDTVTLHDVSLDTVALYGTDTVLLPVSSKADTLVFVDTAWVQVPISEYVFDTCLTTDSTRTCVRGVLRGFDVSLAQLSTSVEISAVRPCLAPKTGRWCVGVFVGPSVSCKGVGLGVGVGVGYLL